MFSPSNLMEKLEGFLNKNSSSSKEEKSDFIAFLNSTEATFRNPNQESIQKENENQSSETKLTFLNTVNAFSGKFAGDATLSSTKDFATSNIKPFDSNIITLLNKKRSIPNIKTNPNPNVQLNVSSLCKNIKLNNENLIQNKQKLTSEQILLNKIKEEKMNKLKEIEKNKKFFEKVNFF